MRIEVVQCGMCKHYDSEQYCEVWEQYITNDAFYCACGAKADRKTENCSEFPNNCEDEQMETQTETQNSNLTFEKRTMRDCYNCKRYEAEGECIECHYEPTDEPQTNADRDEIAERLIMMGLINNRKTGPTQNQHIQSVESVGEDRKTEPTVSKMEQVEDDAYFLELMGAVERGKISDAGANQAWYEYINHKDEPQTCSFSDCDNFKNPDYARCIECKRKQIMLKDEPQAERSGEVINR